MLNHKLKTILVLTCLAISLKSYAHNLPDLGSPGLVTYDRQTEIKLGQAFTQALHSEVDLIKDPEVLSYVRRIGHRLAEHAQDGRSYRFYVINDPSINAFAGPDGIIGIHSGLILAAEREDELASVIAHEIAHVTQEHLSRRFEQQSTLNITSFATLLAAILIGSQNPGAGVAAMMGATGLSIQEQLRYSRIHEHEADHFGIELLHKSGYDPHSMASFFSKLARRQQIYEFRPPEILMTHPVTENRLAQASNRASKFTQQIGRHDPINLPLVQLRLNQQIKPNVNHEYMQTLKCYQSYLKPQTITNLTPSCLNQALEAHPNNRLLKAQLLKIQLTKEPDDTLLAFNKLLELYPQDEALLLMAAQAYRTIGEEHKAQRLILNNLDKKRYTFELYQELSQSFAEQQLFSEAYLFEAQAYLSLGNHQRAKHLINQSKRANPSISQEFSKQLSYIEQKLKL